MRAHAPAGARKTTSSRGWRRRRGIASGRRICAYAAIGSVLGQETETPPEFLDGDDGGAGIAAACADGGRRRSGLTVRAHPAERRRRHGRSRIASRRSPPRPASARASWRCATTGGRHDHGPLVGQSSEVEDAGRVTSDRCDGLRDVRRRDGRAHAGRRDGGRGDADAVRVSACYRPFPTGQVRCARAAALRRVRHPLGRAHADRHGDRRRHVRHDHAVSHRAHLRRGDSAGRSRSCWSRFGLALARRRRSAMSLFKLVQGIAAVRIQARMEAAIQSAMWDRVLSLPAAFFRAFRRRSRRSRRRRRRHPVADLWRVGMSAMLGAISGLFFVVQMITYTASSRWVGVGLTMVFVCGERVRELSAVAVSAARRRLQGPHRRTRAQLDHRRLQGADQRRGAARLPRVGRSSSRSSGGSRSGPGTIQAGATVFSTTFPISRRW